MSGKAVGIVMLVFAVVFGVALYYFQVYAYYRQVDGVTAIEVQERTIPVNDYRGIDAETSPNKLRGCFEADPAEFAGLAEAEDPQPLVAPGWFDCFDAAALSQDIAEGRARAYVAADETPETATEYEVLRFVAIYPDGRGYLWRHYRESE